MRTDETCGAAIDTSREQYTTGGHSAKSIVPTNRAAKWLQILLFSAFALFSLSQIAFGAILLPTATIIASDPSASTDGNPGEFTVQLNMPAPFGGVLVNYSVGGSAIPAVDYQALSGNVFIPMGRRSAAIPVNTIVTLSSEDKTVVATLAPGTGYQVGNPSSATVTLFGFNLTATIMATDPSASTDGDPGELAIQLSAPAPPSGITLDYAIGGTAVPGVDYQALSGNVYIPVGQNLAVVPVNPIATYSGDDKSVVATLEPGVGYQVGSPSSATVTLFGFNLTATIMATDPSASTDGSDSGEFTVLLSSSAPPGGVTVNYEVSGTAVPGVDYQALVGSVYVPAAQDSAVVAVDPIATYATDDKTVVVTLASGTGYQVGSPSSATVTLYFVRLRELWVQPGAQIIMGTDGKSFSFAVPVDFQELVSAKVAMVGRVDTESSANIYLAIGQNMFPIDHFTDTMLGVPVSINAGEIIELDVSAVFPSLNAGVDYATVHVETRFVQFLGLRFIYYAY